MKLSNIVLAFSLVLLSCGASAGGFPQTLTLSWTNASEYTDATPIEAVDLTGVRIECVRVNDGSALLTATFVPTGVGLTQSEVFVDVITKAGVYECVGFTIVSDGDESVASNTAPKKFIGKPMTITNVTVN